MFSRDCKGFIPAGRLNLEKRFLEEILYKFPGRGKQDSPDCH